MCFGFVSGFRVWWFSESFGFLCVSVCGFGGCLAFVQWVWTQLGLVFSAFGLNHINDEAIDLCTCRGGSMVSHKKAKVIWVAFLAQQSWNFIDVVAK